MHTQRRPHDAAPSAAPVIHPAGAATATTPAASPPAPTPPVSSAVALDAASALDRDAVWSTRRIRAFLATPAAAAG
jgi:hypothetical protein